METATDTRQWAPGRFGAQPAVPRTERFIRSKVRRVSERVSRSVSSAAGGMKLCCLCMPAGQQTHVTCTRLAAAARRSGGQPVKAGPLTYGHSKAKGTRRGRRIVRCRQLSHIIILSVYGWCRQRPSTCRPAARDLDMRRPAIRRCARPGPNPQINNSKKTGRH